MGDAFEEGSVSVELLRQRRVWTRAYGAPFLAVYAAAAAAGLRLPHAEFAAPALCAGAALLHALCWLFTKWSVRWRRAADFRPCRSAAAAAGATHALARPPPHHGAAAFCPLAADRASFEFQRLRFVRCGEAFAPLAFPDSASVGAYLGARGVASDGDLSAAEATYGPNRFDVPRPTFWELYREQAVAPFFVFQMFCVALWSLDEHPTYSLFMLVMLLVFEGTVVLSRLRNLATLRDTVARAPTSIAVFRMGRWVHAPSDRLVPGDLISIVKGTAPCDVVLIAGSAVVNESMLTGESTPHLKEALGTDDDSCSDEKSRLPLSPDVAHKHHVVFAGTQVLQVTPPERLLHSLPKIPDSGAPAVVLRTGFATSQGRLMRTILFASEHTTANNAESFAFIGFLLVFALAASGYVMHRGLQDPERSRWKLLLNCTLIITSVVPPELPMELSLAVNTSLLALRKLAVFCTEPFRIPFAGALDTCCFDKTGTLTSDDLHLSGVAGIDAADVESAVSDPARYSDETMAVLAGCHSLVLVEGQVLGDPVETAALEGIGWVLTGGDHSVERVRRSGHLRSLRLIHRYGFSSALRRMSTIVGFSSGISGQHERILVTCKGAPEVIRGMLADVPSFYDAIFEHYAAQGGRVLALATKELAPGATVTEMRSIPREAIEAGLVFAGFAVFACTVKPESKPTIGALRGASLESVMITGDNTLTACHVARETGIAQKPLLVLADDGNALVWHEITGTAAAKVTLPLGAPFEHQKREARGLLRRAQRAEFDWDLCVGGDTLDRALESPFGKEIVTKTAVFSRVAPEQKARVVSAMKAAGRVVLMCGDGTNDVGALRQAQVGVALLTPAAQQSKQQPTKPNSSASASSSSAQHRKRQPQQQQQQQQMPPGAKKLESLQEQRRKALEKKRAELMSEFAQQDAPAVAGLGDASIASPFTCRSLSIAPVQDIVRQGRCTLASTHQMYRILALNSLVSAYTLSALYFESVKMGDLQATATGMLIAFCFMFVSRGKPLEKLSKERPMQRLFHPSMVLSVFAQSAVHLGAIIYSLQLAKSALPPDAEPEDPDAPFKPTLVNSVVFLVSCAMQVSSFAVNHRGHPFMQSLVENRGLGLCLLALSGVMWLSALEVSPEWNATLELVPFPSAEFRRTIVCIMLADLVLAWLVDRVICLLLGKVGR